MNLFQKLQRKMADGTLHQMGQELKWILSYSVRYRKSVIFYTFLGLLGVGLSLGAGVMSKWIVDAVTGYDSTALLPAAVAYIAMQLFRIVTGIWTGRISARVNLRVNQQIRGEVYDRVMNTRWEEISKFHSGDILSRVEGDVSTVASSVLGWLPDFVTKLVQLLGTLGVILYYDATLALLALAAAPVTLLLSTLVMKRLRIYNRKLREVSAKLMAFHEESFQNVQTIQSFGLGQVYGGQLRRIQRQQEDAVVEHTKFQTGTTGLLHLVSTVTTLLCFGWGVYRLWSGHITYGTMTLFLQLAGSISGAFSALVHMFPTAVSAATAAGRIMAVSQLPQEDYSNKEAAEAFRSRCDGGVTVQAQSLSCRYADGDTVLEDVSFRAEPGEIVAIIGPSGEGKTTILRLLLGIMQPGAGALTLQAGGEKMDICPSTRSFFAYVPQRSTLFSGTVGENLRLLKPQATDAEIFEALEAVCAADFVRALPRGLDAPVQEQGGGFSQGQIQRLMLARALLSDAPVLLLDEATSALDPETESRVLENLLQCKGNRTCIVTTHRMQLLSCCDRVYRVQGKEMTPVEHTKENCHG